MTEENKEIETDKEKKHSKCRIFAYCVLTGFVLFAACLLFIYHYFFKIKIYPLINIKKSGHIGSVISDADDNVLLISSNKDFNIQEYNSKLNKIINLGKMQAERNINYLLLHNLNDDLVLICGGQYTSDNDRFCEIFSKSSHFSLKTEKIKLSINAENDIIRNLDDKHFLIIDNFKHALYEYSLENYSINYEMPLPENISKIENLIVFNNNILFFIDTYGKYYWFDYKNRKKLYEGDLKQRYFNAVSNNNTVFISGGTSIAHGISDFYDADRSVFECSIQNMNCVKTGSLGMPRARHKAVFLDDNNIFYAGGVPAHHFFEPAPFYMTGEIYNINQKESVYIMPIAIVFINHFEFFINKISRNKVLFIRNDKFYILEFKL